MSASIPAWAVRGAKVVCVNARRMSGLKEGDVYTIERAVMSERPRVNALGERDGGGPAVIVAEAFNDLECNYGDGRYDLSRFRPLVTRTQEQDIEEFFSHHLRQPHRIEERV